MSTRPQLPYFHRQRGAVLVVSLLILLILTIIGVTAMSNSSLEEKMAGNMRDRSLAFQSAEAALRAGENLIEALPDIPSLANDDCTDGLCTARENDADYDPSLAPTHPHWIDQRWVENGNHENLHVWTTANRHRVYANTIAEVSSQPMFIIEFLAYVAPPGSPVGYIPAAGDPEMYRITALATGGSPNSRVLLQSTYRKEP